MITNSKEFAKEVRKLSLGMVYRAHASHIGGALSMADMLAVLYTSELNYKADEPEWDGRDRLIVSKGHACVSLYASLALSGFIPIEELLEYGKIGSRLLSHVTHHVPGIEFSSGSLGHGLPIACGLALAAKRQYKNHRCYVIVGDGEMDEGSNWEALLFAAHYNLDNICLIIDYNKIQSLGNTNEVLNLEPFADKLKAFNWNVIQIDGHNHDSIRAAFKQAKDTNSKPTVVIADTIKGKGISFWENTLVSHYKSPTEEQYHQAIKEIEG